MRQSSLLGKCINYDWQSSTYVRAFVGAPECPDSRIEHHNESTAATTSSSVPGSEHVICLFHVDIF